MLPVGIRIGLDEEGLQHAARGDGDHKRLRPVAKQSASGSRRDSIATERDLASLYGERRQILACPTGSAGVRSVTSPSCSPINPRLPDNRKTPDPTTRRPWMPPAAQSGVPR